MGEQFNPSSIRTLFLLLIGYYGLIEGKNYANISGDIYLAAFFPIHALKPNLYHPSTFYLQPPTSNYGWGRFVDGPARNISECGDVQEEDGIQALEAFFHALDEVNNGGFLPGFKLGAFSFDSCEDERHAQEQAVDLIQVLINSREGADSNFQCSDGSHPQLTPDAEGFSKVVGIVGGTSSDVSIALASLFRLFEIPQVSYLSTSPDLSNKERFPYFLRTVPPDTVQARAIVELLKVFNWTYVSVLYDNSNYGNKGFAELERVAADEGICIAYSKTINFENWNAEDYDNAIVELCEKPLSKTVILWVDLDRARNIFAAARRMNKSDGFTWVGSDAWSDRIAAVTGYEAEAEGAITVQPLAYKMPAFDQYFTGLKPHSNTRNPWFREFWERHFNCKLQDDFGPDQSKTKCEECCTGNEEIGPGSGYVQGSYLHFVNDTVYAYAHALKNMHYDICGPQSPGLCDSMQPTNLSGEVLLHYLTTVNFTSSSGRNFTFSDGVDGPPRYTLLNLQLSPGQKPNHTWREAGEFSAVPGEEEISFEPDFCDDMDSYPSSICSHPCDTGYAKTVSPGEKCCWLCTKCDGHQIVVPQDENLMCVDCALGNWPTENRSSCIPLEVVHISYADHAAIGAIVLSSVGVFVSLFVLFVFLVYNSTPVIKASSRELSLYMLFGIFISYISTFVFTSQPSEVICGTTRVLLGMSYTIMYASILTKTNRISRIFTNSTGSPKRARFTTPKLQLLIVNIVVLVEVIILGCWMVVSPPSVKNYFPSPADNILVCSGAEDATYLVGLGYPFILLVLCTIYAFKTRKTPDGFNETRLIGFTCYTTCVMWIMFVPTYILNRDYITRTLILCLSVSISATVALLVLFFPKVYICMFRPGKNTKEAVMTRSASSASSNAVPSLERKPTFQGIGASDQENSTNNITKITSMTTRSPGTSKHLDIPKSTCKVSPLMSDTRKSQTKNKEGFKGRETKYAVFDGDISPTGSKSSTDIHGCKSKSSEGKIEKVDNQPSPTYGIDEKQSDQNKL